MEASAFGPPRNAGDRNDTLPDRLNSAVEAAHLVDER
jgi:hypothetical protein